jgi:hypothetical protein
MCSVPEHPFFKEVVNNCIKNILSEYYGKNELHITGPSFLYREYECFFKRICKDVSDDIDAFNEFKLGIIDLGCDRCKINFLQFVCDDYNGYHCKIIDLDDTLICYTKFKNYSEIMYPMNRTPHYTKLWANRGVYKSVN